MKTPPQRIQDTRNNIIGPRVRQARLRSCRRLTQQQLADRVVKLGVYIDRAGIAKIEIGLRCVCDFEVLILAKALHVAVAWLLPVRTALRRERH
jgi:transcriptional regulator with XRE-family HTH domain